MTPQIKQRIDQLRRGEVPEGYKKTKVGIVPSDWEENNLGKYLHEYRELSNDIAKYPVYSSSRQGLIPQSQYYDNREAVETNLGYKIVPTGYVTYRHMSDDDIFHFNINNTGCEVLVSSEYPVFTSTQKGELGYIIPLLNHTARFRHFCRMQKMGGTRTRLYYKNLCEFKVAFPPLAEQKKIAEILSAQDKLIALKEKLIEEKKRQKKYLMQQLLTGKKRLPGFSGEWETTTFGQIGTIVSGGTPDTTKAIYWDGDIPWCTPTDITKSGKYINDTEKHITEEGLTNSSANLMPENSILMCSRASIGPRCINTKTMATNQGFKNLICDTNKVVIEYVYDLIGLCVPDLIKLASGSTFLELSKNDFSNYAIKIPSLNEQVAIAKILTKADNEIELLRKNLDQEKQKKKALMQLLLSGVVRVY